MIESIKPTANKVLVKVEKQFEDVLNSGVQISTMHNPQFHTTIKAEVVKVCDRLIFSKRNAHSMEWECDIDIREGDTVITNFDIYFKAKDNKTIFKENDTWYYIIDYADISLAMRGGETIMCNGYILCEPIMIKDVDERLYPKTALLDIPNQNVYQKRFAKIYRIGKPNKNYLQSGRMVCNDLNLGDLVILRNGAARFLETSMVKRYEQKDLWIVQDWMILAKIEEK